MSKNQKYTSILLEGEDFVRVLVIGTNSTMTGLLLVTLEGDHDTTNYYVSAIDLWCLLWNKNVPGKV